MIFDRKKYISFDIESSGTLPEYALQPFRHLTNDAWLTSYAVTYDDGSIKSEGCLFPTKEIIESVLDKAIDNNLTIVGWNTSFEVAWCIAYGLYDKVIQIKWLDAMLLWKHLTVTPEYDVDSKKKKSFGLKDAVREFLPEWGNYEDGVDYHSTDEANLKKLLHYNKLDTIFTLKLADKFFNELTEKQQRVALIEAKSIVLAGNTYIQGLTINVEAAKSLDSNLVKTYDESLETLKEYSVTPEIVKSPTQLAKLLFDDWGLPVLKENIGAKTQKVSRSTDKETLHELSLIDPRAKIVRTFRESIGNRKKFVTNTFESVEYNGDGKTRPIPKIYGTYSGRMTYSSKQGRNKDERPTGVALHQWKRGKDFRRLITVPEGFVLCETDAASQEFKLMACASGDETMLQLCQPGEDPHSYTGAAIAHRDYRGLIDAVKSGESQAESDRKYGKLANLSLQYRTSAPKLRTVARVQYGIPMELPEAQNVRETYLRTYRGVPKYWKDQIRICKAQGYAETFAGRRVQLGHDWGRDSWSKESTSINFRIQGTGADMKYLGLAVVQEFLNKNGCYFYYELHDGLFWLLPEDNYKYCALMIQKILNNLPYEKAWGWQPPIQLNWDCKVGPSWGDLKELEA